MKAKENSEDRALKEWVDRWCSQRYASHAELARAARISPASLSLILNNKRNLTNEVAVRLAEALCPPTRRLGDFAKELYAVAHLDASSPVPTESVVDRLERGARRIRVGLVEIPPFLRRKRDGQPEGLIFDVFRSIVGLLNVRYDPTWLELKDVRRAVEEEGFDIIVSAVLQTFERRSFLAFTRPLPFLQVPLSGVCAPASTTTSEQVLNWQELSSEGLRDTRLLLVRGEVGTQFVRAFLTGVDLDDPTRVQFQNEVSKRLYEALSDAEGPDLFLGGLDACVSICQCGDQVRPLVSSSHLDSHSQWNHRARIRGKDKNFPVLGLYQIGLGLPRFDAAWLDLTNMALESLTNEGARILCMTYEKHLRAQPSIAHFCDIRSEQWGVSETVREAFEKLFDQYRFK